MKPADLSCLQESLQPSSDIRRNVDAHVYLKVSVFGSINGDREKVYLPMINLRYEVFYRQVALDADMISIVASKFVLC